MTLAAFRACEYTARAGLHPAENPTSLFRRGVFRQYRFRDFLIVGKRLLHRARVQHFVNQHIDSFRKPDQVLRNTSVS